MEGSTRRKCRNTRRVGLAEAGVIGCEFVMMCMMLQPQICQIEQRLTRTAIAHPGALETAHLVIQREACTQNRQLKALCDLHGMGGAN